jgi:hypothetical protein
MKCGIEKSHVLGYWQLFLASFDDGKSWGIVSTSSSQLDSKPKPMIFTVARVVPVSPGNGMFRR